MEIIIVLAVIALIAVVWARDKANKSKDPVDTWEPPKEMHLTDKPWPYGEKLSEGKIHVKTTDVAPGKSADDRVEAPAPVPLVVEQAPAKKPAAKKTAAKPAVAKKPAAAKRAPAKKKSV